LPDQHSYVDDAGQPFELPADDSSRVVIRVDEHGEPVAVLIKDGAIHQDERLLADVAAALRLALGNARLRAQVRANIDQLGIARRRLVEAADGQRRQLESELDGGPRRQLSEMSRLIENIDAQAEASLREKLTPLLAELATANDELRDLAHGIRPPALESGGLAAALPLLVQRAEPDPVDLTVPGGRLPPAVEGAVYYVCAEALTNIAKHANAARASVAITVDHGAVVAQIVDDGRGGADRNGSGLRGLADRVEALGGQLSVTDRSQGGTVVMARIPLEEAS
jgi:signal transduction histidine kinase